MRWSDQGTWLLTLNIRNALLENLLKGLGVLELLRHLGDDGRGELVLLALLDLALVADPRVEDSLGLGGEGRLLLELEGLGLELGGFLADTFTSISARLHFRCPRP